MSSIDLERWPCGSADAARIGGTTTHTLQNWRVKNGLFKEKARGRGAPLSFYLKDIIKIAAVGRMIRLGVSVEFACRKAQGSGLLASLVTGEPLMLGWRDGQFVHEFRPDEDPYLCIPIYGLTRGIVDQLADGIAFQHDKATAEEAKAEFWRRVEVAATASQAQAEKGAVQWGE